ncbi:MAG: hypothetical protein HGA33_03325 [Candidatus Moranbacteria bacterium]|nr:hypothetical protein [Candidatus Moranbacteria bacterium]
MNQTRPTDPLIAYTELVMSIFMAPFKIANAAIDVLTRTSSAITEDQTPISRKTPRKSPLPILVSGIPFSLVALEVSTLTAIGKLKLKILPYTMHHDPMLSSIAGSLTKSTMQLFDMIRADFLPGRLEELRNAHPGMIVANPADADAALWIAELCCPLRIPFITAISPETKPRLKELIERSSIPAVVLTTIGRDTGEHVIDGIRSITLLAQKMESGATGCFSQEDFIPV